MTPTVQVHTREQLLVRRAELLVEAGMDELSLRRAAARYALDPEHVAILDEIDRIDYLLGA